MWGNCLQILPMATLNPKPTYFDLLCRTGSKPHEAYLLHAVDARV